MNQLHKLTLPIIKEFLKPRNENSHKGTYGYALLIAGCIGKIGSALISSKACMRSGVGLLTTSIPFTERGILQTAIPEAMLQFREEKNVDFTLYSAVGIGPGMGCNLNSIKLIKNIISNCKQALTLDADALNCLSLRKKLLLSLPKNSILTPHPKEFDRLFGEHKDIEDRHKKAIQKALELNIIIVLKGHQTLITNGQISYLNTTGNSGLAKAGSGDALTGIITSLLSQGYKALHAALLGVYIHGLAADHCLKKQSEESMLITDVIECIGKAFKQIRK